MKKFITIILVMMLLVLNGCSSKEENKDALETIKERGYMIIATEGTWAPYTYHDEDDNLTGFDVEVIKLVCEKLNVKAEFVEGAWDGLLEGVSSGRYDTMANCVEVTDERKEKFNFSDPYAYVKTVIIVKKDSDIDSFEDLKGKKTANTLQSSYAALAQKYGAEVTGVDDFIQTIELLLAGRIDATLNDELTYLDYLSSHEDADVKVAAKYPEANHVSFNFKKDDSTKTLIEAVNNALKELSDEGKLTELSLKFFNVDITK